MESEVENLPEQAKQEECSMINGVEGNIEVMKANEEEPSEETTDKMNVIQSSNNHVEMEDDERTCYPGSPSYGPGDAEIKQEPLESIRSFFKEWNNQEDIGEDDDDEEEEEEGGVEEEVEEKDEVVDKIEDEKPENKELDNPDEPQCDDKLSFLGRNRRVRQKNRYFLDFHCVDLTKGARSNRDDYDAFTSATTTTRSSNRRSTTDSARGQQDEPEVFESRHCRKCLTKTPHDFDGGCQACLYKKIVESSKRYSKQKPSNQRSRSGNNSKQQNDNNELESTSTTTPSSNKRKSSSKQKSRSRKIVIVGNCSDSSNDNNVNNGNPALSQPPSQPITSQAPSPPSAEPITDTNISPNDIKNDINCGKLPKLDTWSPDEVAEYIMSKGFAHEAELFKTQSVDGISLLLMQRTDFTYGLKIKLGPALKIYDQVCKLKKEYFKTVTISQQ